ncbi:MAG TPA: carboxypeptidase regulatory-like domain-containing protein [Vicinamibacterales bacterium]|nr:carboxypeptidase regulatory-like domain-containing protein [Vicinamibacterales bacterium]
MRAHIFVLCIAALAVSACSGSPSKPDPAAAESPRDAASGARITGKVVVDGVVTSAAELRFDADPQCVSIASREARRAEHLVVGEANALRNVFVYVKQGLPAQAYPPPREAVMLDQQQCRYVPRVLGVQVDQPVRIRNSDPLLHTVHAQGTVNNRFNLGTPVQGMEVNRVFRAAEVMVPVTCDMHPWMNAYIGVLDHPFFDVTTESGRFSLTGLPPGAYVIAIWHERLGTQTQDVEVSAGEARELTFTYTLS